MEEAPAVFPVVFSPGKKGKKFDLPRYMSMSKTLFRIDFPLGRGRYHIETFESRADADQALAALYQEHLMQPVNVIHALPAIVDAEASDEEAERPRRVENRRLVARNRIELRHQVNIPLMMPEQERESNYEMVIEILKEYNSHPDVYLLRLIYVAVSCLIITVCSLFCLF
jgi:hypothetical protein